MGSGAAVHTPPAPARRCSQEVGLAACTEWRWGCFPLGVHTGLGPQQPPPSPESHGAREREQRGSGSRSARSAVGGSGRPPRTCLRCRGWVMQEAEAMELTGLAHHW